MNKFMKIGGGVDVLPLLLQIQRQPELWDRNKARLLPHGPHRDSHDIWIRYKDETENLASCDYSNFADQHDPIWYPAYYALPAIRPIVFGLMARVEGERLGGILIYKLEPGKVIHPHIDPGWHPNYYEKFNVSLRSEPGCVFHYEDEKMRALTGDVYWYTNNTMHWCTNESPDDQIVMSVSIRTHARGVA